MGTFWRAFWGATAGRIVTVVALAIVTAAGFGVDFWLHRFMTWWGANPTDATIATIRIAATAIGIAGIGAILVPAIWVALTRKFSVSFDRGRDVHAAVPLFDTVTRLPLPNRTTFIHVHVEAVRQNVTLCTGAITLLEQLDDKGGVTNRITGTRSLLWAPREAGQSQQNIAPSLPQDLDLFCTIEGDSRLHLLSVGHPQLWVNFFNNPGRYRITVAVHGGS